MHRKLAGTLIALIASLCLTAAASAAPIAPYDGENPFRCKTQNTGTGVDFRDPDADPFCVKYDKTQQNVTDFGLVEFLLLEPARVAAAVPKCFYHQTDHWTGSVVQGSGPEIWNWEGRYFFDKARGMGGVYVENFRIGGVPADPRRCRASRPSTGLLRPRRRRRVHGHRGGGALLRGEGRHASRGEAGVPAGWRYPKKKSRFPETENSVLHLVGRRSRSPGARGPRVTKWPRVGTTMCAWPSCPARRRR